MEGGGREGRKKGGRKEGKQLCTLMLPIIDIKCLKDFS
jgi:hypothetical protein